MYTIKQNTALTVPFFVHDVSGDPVTGLSGGSFTKRISKNGAAFGAMTVTVTEMENGWYSIPLSATHSNTLGLLSITFTNGGAKQINLQWRVETRLADDLATPTNITALANGAGDWNVGKTGYSVNALAANTITAASINAAALNGKGDWNIGKTGYSLTVTPPTASIISDAVWDELLAGHVIADSAGLLLNDWQDGGRLDLILDLIPNTSEFNARTILSASYFDPAADTVVNVTNVTAAVTVGTINANVITAASINAAALNGKGDWNIGKTGYSLTQAFPSNFASLVITAGGAVDSLLQGYLNTLIAESTAGRIAANFDNFYDNADAATTKVVDNVGGGSLSAADKNSIADHLLRRTLANARASSDGDALNFRSLLGAGSKLVNKVSISGANLLITEEDDATTFGTQAVTTDAAADPITALDTT